MEFKFGEEQFTLDWGGTDYLGDWAAEGSMSITSWDIPPDAVQFMLSQFNRFGVPFPPEMIELLDSCWNTLLYYLNHFDPYCIYSGLTEVEITEDWQKFAYCITPPGCCATEIPAEKVETYKLYPGNDQIIFNDLMGKPGLGAISQMSLKEELFYDGSYFEFWENLSDEIHETLDQLCTMEVNGESTVILERKEAYIDLGIWAALMFLISPDQRDLRMSMFPILACCYEGGEAIIYENEIFDGTFYTKHARNPLSCSECGIVSWCVELAQLGNTSRYICESCLNVDDGIQKRPYACGLRMCPVVRCPNHPQHGEGASGLGYYKSHGQLNSMTPENPMVLASKKAKPSLT